MTGARRPVVCILALTMLFAAGCGREQATESKPPQKTVAMLPPTAGAQLFRQFCANCHPDGGNISDPARTLHARALRARNITTSAEIVKVMRNPASRMIRFDTETLPDREASAIAEYVMTTFK